MDGGSPRKELSPAPEESVKDSGNERTSSPYATGGGGFALEHQYGALALVHLLTGDPIPELGNDAAVTLVSFQAAYESAVDDLVLHGLCGDGSERRVAVAVRRKPRLVPSDVSSVELFASFLEVATEHGEDLNSGRWRLALVSVQSTPVHQLGELAAIARAEPHSRAFREGVTRPRRTTQKVRQRLVQVDRLFAAAAEHLGIDGKSVDDLTWRVLKSLTIRLVRLEPPDESDRSILVARLRRETQDESVSTASQLFDSLAHKASRFAPQAARVDEAMLRRELTGTVQLRRSSGHGDGWAMLDRLSQRLRDRVGTDLRGRTGERLWINRNDARGALALAIEAAGQVSRGESPSLVVTGEPDVGKSSLSLEATSQVEGSDLAVVALSLRDLPSNAAELEHVLGGSIKEILCGVEVRSSRVLLLDGAEAALEGRGEILQDIATAAMEAGLGIVAVTRSDGEEAVADALLRASETASGTRVKPARVLVEELQPKEILQVVGAFGALKRIAEDPRSRWLLGRPGLVNLLLKIEVDYQFGDGALSEADVYAAVWSGLVRQGESTPIGGAGPDEREEALLELARQQLMPGNRGVGATAHVLPSLRSDGLLLPAGPTSPWQPGDQFANDLVRDFALVRLFLREGYELLEESGAPRWALRAVRLACMATMASAGEESERVRIAEERRFEQIAASAGERWAELPLEATLLLEGPLFRAWPALSEGGQDGLRDLIRIARQRYVSAGVAQPAALRPLMTMICSKWYALEGTIGYEIRKRINELTLEWLRGLLLQSEETYPLRTELRRLLLAQDREKRDEFAVEAMASLGSDLDESVEQWLRSLAAHSPGRLSPAVEPVFAVMSLVRHSPDLLAHLTEAYYIVIPDDDDPWQQESLIFNDGIRHHANHDHAFMGPLASWQYGPFAILLSANPILGLRTISRILNHAAKARVEQVKSVQSQGVDQTVDEYERELYLAGVGKRKCLGDSQVWRWYRGSAVGPSPCVSALLAVERFADARLSAGLQPGEVAKLLLKDCYNLAMPGLVVGFLARHSDIQHDELDSWLSQPDVWQLEFDRIANEGRLHIQGPEAYQDDLREARRRTPQEIVSAQVAKALIEDDEDRIASLRLCGQRLMQGARGMISGLEQEDGSRDYEIDSLVTAGNWAAAFDPENYRLRRLADGRVEFSVELPAELAAAKESHDLKMAQVAKDLHLLSTYGYKESRRSESSTIREDLAHGRSVLENPPEDGLDPLVGPAAVAASAILAYSDGRLALNPDEIRWAAELLVACALPRSHAWVDVEESMYIMGADRSAAAAVPVLLLLSAGGEQGVPARREVSKGLGACTTSQFLEVRQVAAQAMKEVWEAKCAKSGLLRRCFHREALKAVEAGIRDCRIGPRGKDGRRHIAKLKGRLLPALQSVPADEIVLSRFGAPLIALSDAAISNCCIAGRAKRNLIALLDAHARAAAAQDPQYYLRPSPWEEMHSVAVTLFSLAARGDKAPLVGQLETLMVNTAALQHLLRDLLEVVTYDDAMRAELPSVWPAVMTTVLDALDSGSDLGSDDFYTERVLAHLIPHPEVKSSDPKMDLTVKNAIDDWLDPATIDETVGRWIALARGWPMCADAAIQLIRAGEVNWQASVGLSWIHKLTDEVGGRLANQCWYLMAWLQDISDFDGLQPRERVMVQHIVDELATHGDDRAVRMQREQE